MREEDWVGLVARRLEGTTIGRSRSLSIRTRLRLAYSYEIASYEGSSRPQRSDFETDLALIEISDDGSWKPRVVVEAKLLRVSTHDAITYSHKAAVHRSVHPYLRYGIMLGDRRGEGLPGRLVRHGDHFDFMASFRSTRPSVDEITGFVKVLRLEVRASRKIERILYDSRKRDRDRYTLLHRRLVVR